METLTARGEAVDVGQQLGLGHTWISHQTDVNGPCNHIKHTLSSTQAASIETNPNYSVDSMQCQSYHHV